MRTLLLAALALTGVVHADVRGDYAVQWPLVTRGEAGAYRVVLGEDMYRASVDVRVRDIDVVDATGTPVPSGLFAADRDLAQRIQRVPLRWFALPAAPATGQAQGWELQSELDADGRLRNVQARVTGMTADALPRNVFIVDASQLRADLRGLRVQWRGADTLDAGYRVDASDDLDRWRPLAERGRLVDLQRDGTRLVQQRIGIDTAGTRPRYLRLTPDRNDTRIDVIGIEAEIAVPAAPPAIQWIDLRGTRDAKSAATWTFELDARIPVAQVDVVLPGNHAVEWQLDSRTRGSATKRDDMWTPRVGRWMAYGVANARGEDRSAPRVLTRITRDRLWRLRGTGAVPATPVLRVGYRPEVLVFVAQGTPPYAVVAGSGRARRADAPIAPLIDALRTARGVDWQPDTAQSGAFATLAGDAARDATAPRDWRTWLLWAVLVLGALVVAVFALQLLRAQDSARDP